MPSADRSFPAVVILIGILSLSGCAVHRAPRSAVVSPPPSDSTGVDVLMHTSTGWIDDQLEQLTLEEKIGQMVMARATGVYVSDESTQFTRLVRLVRDLKIGGLVFFQGDMYATSVLINRLQRMADVPLLIAADFEFGAAMRLRRTTRFPDAMALGATRDTALAFSVGQAIGEEARAIGVQQVYAPVADVNSNPDNPVINTRSFGEDPILVAGMGVAYTRGLQSMGAIATAKHFPGHGDTHVDSHLGLPVLDSGRGRLDSVELLPFTRLIQHGVLSVMVAHLDVPSLEQRRGLPSTLSGAIVTDLLKRDFRFEGLVVTDALEMGAVVEAYGSDSAAVLAVEAGVDMLVLPADENAAVDALIAAVRRGRISRERIDESVRKILTVKQWARLDEVRTVEIDSIGGRVALPRHTDLARDVARASITVLRQGDGIPVGRDRRTLLTVIVSDVDDYRTDVHRHSSLATNERAGDYFATQVRNRTAGSQFLRLDPSANSMAIDSILRSASSADLVLLPIYSKVRSGSGKFGLPPGVAAVVDSILRMNVPSVLIALGSPYVLRLFPAAKSVLCSYSDAEVSVEAAVEVLFGERSAGGRLPVSIPDLFPYGSGLSLPQAVLRRDLPASVGVDPDSLALADSVMLAAIRDSAFPGGQLVVVKDGTVILNRSYGTMEYGRGTRPVTNRTMYDLASLTKVFATTAAVMKLYDEGRITLDDTVSRYIPEFGNNGKESITIRHLLLHTSGMPAFRALYRTCATAEQVLDSIYQSGLLFLPGDSTLYSDFGFIVLGKLVEKVTSVPLDAYVRDRFIEPLGMKRTMFTPPESFWDDIAPTEVDTSWRHRVLRGSVHDETAALLGGVAGHAGLFSTASDLAIFVQMLLNGGTYGNTPLLSRETVGLFTMRSSADQPRALGWDLKSVRGYASSGTLFSMQSYGHTGFTGTSVWIEPEKNIFIILLTNRVHPTRENTKIVSIRPVLHDVVKRAVRGAVPPGR